MAGQFWNVVVDLCMHKGFALGSTENESSKAVQVLHLNNTGNRLEIALTIRASKKSSGFNIIFVHSLQALVQLRKHLLGCL